MGVEINPIGIVSHDSEDIPRSYTVSDVVGRLVIDKKYIDGLSDIRPGQKLYVLFLFHKSPKFSEKRMRIKPPHRDRELGVFSTHSPYRPNPIGLSIVETLDVDGSIITVKGLDMFNGTPILDIKPDTCSA